eukprot:Tamp_09117.p1 GENE.Tamp_09117~~Tamp_09117.p1  ORF type:complete len:262 (+),score=10.63 Tamp_09117:800-1585(+)
MRIKTKLEPTRAAQAPSAESKRVRPAAKTPPHARGQLAEPDDAAGAGSDDKGVAHLPPARAPGGHAWKAPTKTFKSGGEWVRARRCAHVDPCALSPRAVPGSAGFPRACAAIGSHPTHDARDARAPGWDWSAAPWRRRARPPPACDGYACVRVLLMHRRTVLAVFVCAFPRICACPRGAVCGEPCGTSAARALRAEDRTCSHAPVGASRLWGGPYASGGTARSGGMRVSSSTTMATPTSKTATVTLLHAPPPRVQQRPHRP